MSPLFSLLAALLSVMGLGLSALAATPPVPAPQPTRSAAAKPVVAPKTTAPAKPSGAASSKTATTAKPKVAAAPAAKKSVPATPGAKKPQAVVAKKPVAKPAKPVAKVAAKPKPKPKAAPAPRIVSYPEPASQEQAFLRTTPIQLPPVDAQKIPATLTADEALALLKDDTLSQGVHMEVIRRAADQLAEDESKKVIEALYARYQEDPTNAAWFFDHGYAQLMFLRNKTGLFFLRKANDRLMNQYTQLAYAIAQVEADWVAEGQSPNLPTARKVDIMFKLKDAINLQAESPVEGFWPTFVGLQRKLQPYAAYEQIADRDFTYDLLPRVSYKVIPSNEMPPKAWQFRAPVPAPAPTGRRGRDVIVPTPVAATNAPLACAPGGLLTQAQMLTPDRYIVGQWFSPSPGKKYGMIVYHHPSSSTKARQYQVLIVDAANHPVLLVNPVGNYQILEDPDQNGLPDVVVRRYAVDPVHPVAVWQFQSSTGCYVENTTLTRVFR